MADNEIKVLNEEQRRQAAKDEGEPADEFNANRRLTVPDVFESILKSSSVEVAGEEQTSSFTGIRQNIENETNIDLGDISERLEGLDGELGNVSDSVDFLSIIAQAAVKSAELNQVAATSQVAQLSTLQSILREVSPPSTIRVSGTNTIDESNSPEQVVPQSSTKDIPTRVLIVQASQSNQKPIYFGDDNVFPQNGFRLDRGEYKSLAVNLNDTQLYMASEESGQQVNLLALS